MLNKWQSRWQEEMTKPRSWLGNVRGSETVRVALFSPVHLCGLYLLHPLFPPRGVDREGLPEGHFGQLSSDGTILRGDHYIP